MSPTDFLSVPLPRYPVLRALPNGMRREDLFFCLVAMFEMICLVGAAALPFAGGMWSALLSGILGGISYL